jgi:hypothetical protein
MDKPEAASEQARRPYEPPAIVSEQIFETTVLACAKRQGQGSKCLFRSKSS